MYTLPYLTLPYLTTTSLVFFILFSSLKLTSLPPSVVNTPPLPNQIFFFKKIFINCFLIPKFKYKYKKKKKRNKLFQIKISLVISRDTSVFHIFT
ncbi:hypothetical protein PPACK8108_LOCUS22900 [Phakopsora pachyrhizi]|uniref:Uncharacterized protein n=1 Tax=Phakopsora pachyrhizi TaxID=170000 RepID=A0AAV0BL99_PHAPC|nr:hypothetical protein PPACK8108_LOCUS22900 [Phakopsora pachyrhizi]